MAVSPEEESDSGYRDSLPAAISNAIVRLLREYTGRGPTTARTTIRDNVVLVILEQTLTKGERSHAARGLGDKVLDIGAEIYVLEAPPDYGARSWQAAAAVKNATPEDAGPV